MRHLIDLVTLYTSMPPRPAKATRDEQADDNRQKKTIPQNYTPKLYPKTIPQNYTPKTEPTPGEQSALPHARPRAGVT